MRSLARIALALACTVSLCCCAETKSLGGLNKLEETPAATQPVAGEMSGPERPADADTAIARPYIEESLKDYAARTGSILEFSPDDAAATGSLAGFEPETPLADADGPTLGGDILGTDDRVTVYDTYQYPYSAIAFMKVTASCGDYWEGTGFMVRPSILLTAAHCLVCSEHHTTASSIELYFGYHSDGSYAYGYWGPTNYWYGTSFPNGYTEEDMAWDYGVVHLEENVGDQTGWLGMQVASDSAFDKGYYQVAGYRDGMLKYDTNTTDVRSDRLIRTHADAVSGNSGGPIFTGDTASAIFIASDTAGTENIGCRITQDIFEKVFEMSGEQLPTTTTNTTDTTQTALVIDPGMTGRDGYVLPYADSHRYTRKEISSLSTYALYIARNEISARHGYIFTNQDLRDYFGSKSWYRGTLTGAQFRSREGILNTTEEKNINTILKLEKKRGSRYVP